MLGYELTEVAAKLKISVAAAQSRLVRGRRELVDLLTDQGPDRCSFSHRVAGP